METYSKLLDRRKVALATLEAQLKKGTKPNKFGTTKEKKANPDIPLEERDRVRINREIAILKRKLFII